MCPGTALAFCQEIFPAIELPNICIVCNLDSVKLLKIINNTLLASEFFPQFLFPFGFT